MGGGLPFTPDMLKNKVGDIPVVGGALTSLVGGPSDAEKAGYGIDAAPEFQRYTTGPGLQYKTEDPLAGQRFTQGAAGGQQLTRAPVSFDQVSPGTGEQFWQQQQGRFQSGGQGQDFFDKAQPAFAAPGSGEQYWNQVAGKANTPQASAAVYQQGQQNLSAPGETSSFYQGARPQLEQGGPTASEEVYNKFAAGPAGLDAYYDRAADKAGQNINRQLAAQGLMGSAFGANEMTDAMVGLAAEQANRDADYRLRQAQTAGSLARGADTGNLEELRLGGQLAQMADANTLQRMNTLGQLGQTADAADLARMMGMGNLAFGAQGQQLSRLGQGMQGAMGLDASDLSKLTAGMQGSAMAQGLQEQRGQRMLDNIFRQQQATSGYLTPQMQSYVNTPQELMDAEIAAQLGLAQNQADASRYKGEKFKDDVSFGINTAKDAIGLAGSL